MNMSTPDLIATIGVSILLAAFAAMSAGWLDANSRLYHAANIIGAGMSCWASWQIDFIPFVVLEATWASVAAYHLARSFTARDSGATSE